MELEPQVRPLAWFGDPDLKASVIAKLKQHRAMDEIIQGYYQLHPSGQDGEYQHDLSTREHLKATAGAYKGCAVGCTLPPISQEKLDADDFDWHQELQLQYGIPAWIAERIDEAFEHTEGFEAAANFAVEVIEAIPIGANLWSAGACGGGGRSCEVAMCRRCTNDASPEELIRILAMAPVPDVD